MMQLKRKLDETRFGDRTGGDLFSLSLPFVLFLFSPLEALPLW
jgi:hypothetical protein